MVGIHLVPRNVNVSLQKRAHRFNFSSVETTVRSCSWSLSGWTSVVHDLGEGYSWDYPHHWSSMWWLMQCWVLLGPPMLHVYCTGSQFFQVQLNVLVIIFKLLHGTVLSVFPKVICPFHRRGMLQVPSLKFYHFMGLRKHDFSVPYKHPFLEALLLSLLEGCKELGFFPPSYGIG